VTTRVGIQAYRHESRAKFVSPETDMLRLCRVNAAWRYIYTPQHTFVAWYSNKHTFDANVTTV